MEVEEGKGVLFTITPQRLLAIDMSKLKINQYDPSNFETLPLPVFRVLNLVEKGFPFGMGFFTRDSKLYMVGGEKPRRGVSPALHPFYKEVGHDETFGDKGLSPYVYVSNLSDLITGADSITDSDFPKHHTSMLAGKPFPIVEEIEGKIYVLSGSPWQSYCRLPTPTFEVYDPLIEQWKALPDPPFHASRFKDYQNFEVLAHSVVGTTLYVMAWSDIDNCDCYYSCNVNDGNWNLIGKLVNKVPVGVPLMALYNGKFVPAYKDVFIYFESSRGLRAALIPSDNMIPTRYQVLNEVYGDYVKFPLLLDAPSIRGSVVELGEHEMCIMRPVSIIPNISLESLPDGEYPPSRTILYMATFRVKKLHSSSAKARGPKLLKTADPSDVSQTSSHHDNVLDIQDYTPFLSITCLSKGFYNFDAWGSEATHISGAFFHQWLTHEMTVDSEVFSQRL